MDLYLDSPSVSAKNDFFKLAGAYAARLSEQAENWPQELTSELYKQLSFLSDYDLNVNLDRVESGRGFAFGYADVANKTERPEIEHEAAGIPHIRIPLIVEERMTKPFSIFLDGERVLPMTEERIRECLFNPATFDISATAPRDPSLVEPLMPPQRSGIGMGGEYKMASVNPEAKGSLLSAIASTLNDKDIESFTEKVASDPNLISGFRRSGIAPTLVDVFEKTKRASANDRLLALADHIEPTAVTFQKLPGGSFLVKSANVNAFIEKTAAGEVVPEQDAQQAMGQDNAQQMQPGQTATAVSEPVPEEAMAPAPESKAKPVEEFGQYKLQDAMGNSIMGHVFPTTLSWDGNFSEQPIALFTNGSAYAMQDQIAGELVGKGTNLPEDEPRGDGAFYVVEGGDAIATAPLTIGSAMAGPDGLPHLQATDSFGNQLQVIQMEGLQKPQRISDVEMAIPQNWKFMRLNNQTQLMGDASQMDKAPKVKESQSSITVFFNGAYNLVGGCGLDKISTDLRYELDPVSAEFMLGVLGIDGTVAKRKLAECRRLGTVKLAGLKTICPIKEKLSSATKVASVLLQKMPNLRVDLIKEAAAMEDEGTVDKLLALNFINPENLTTFIGYIPELEETSEHLAEMLLYSYLGMKELPEISVDRSMKALEDVLLGLKSLAGSEPA